MLARCYVVIPAPSAPPRRVLPPRPPRRRVILLLKLHPSPRPLLVQPPQPLPDLRCRPLREGRLPEDLGKVPHVEPDDRLAHLFLRRPLLLQLLTAVRFRPMGFTASSFVRGDSEVPFEPACTEHRFDPELVRGPIGYRSGPGMRRNWPRHSEVETVREHDFRQAELEVRRRSQRAQYAPGGWMRNQILVG